MIKLKNAKKVTLATYKGFVKRNKETLRILCTSSFSGMEDMVVRNDSAKMRPAEETDFAVKNTLGVDAGAYLVLNGRDNFYFVENDYFIGIEVINACGSFTVAVAK